MNAYHFKFETIISADDGFHFQQTNKQQKSDLLNTGFRTEWMVGFEALLTIASVISVSNTICLVSLLLLLCLAVGLILLFWKRHQNHHIFKNEIKEVIVDYHLDNIIVVYNEKGRLVGRKINSAGMSIETEKLHDFFGCPIREDKPSRKTSSWASMLGAAFLLGMVLFSQSFYIRELELSVYRIIFLVVAVLLTIGIFVKNIKEAHKRRASLKE